ncbi:MAG: hypothetical protein H0T73_16875 [Ardenticatenales bacterium]|nr:hypothetical protein [Ardenticatenales bacterium]
MRRVLHWIVLAGWIILLLPPLRVEAQGPGITMESRALYDGTSKYGEWLPIVVDLENKGNDVTGRVQVRVSRPGGETTYAQQLELPRGARKQVTIYVVPNTASRRLQVEFIPEGQEAPLVQAEVEVRPVANIRFMVASLSAGGDGLEALAGINFRGERGPRDEAVLLPLTLEHLPDRPEALRTLDLIILTGVDTSALSPRQQTALEQYVALGGMLVLGGGPEASRVLAGVPTSLQPVTLAGESNLETLAILEQVAGEPVRVNGPFPAARGEPVTSASVRYSEGALPLLVERPVGKGMVYWLALDPALTPFDGWAGTDEFWVALLNGRAIYPPNLPPDVSVRQALNEQLFYALQNLPSLDLPSLRLLVPLLAAYIFVVGPLNYLLLRRQRRMELAWVTIPIITMLFSAGSYGLGFRLRGSDVILNQVSLIQAVPGSEGGYVRSLVGIFSPARRTYTISVAGEPLLTPTQVQGDPFGNGGASGGNALILQGEPALVEGFTVNQWSMQSVTAEMLVTEGYGFDAELETSDNMIKGYVVNRSPHAWEDVVVVLGNEFVRLGDMAAGERKEVSLGMGEVGNQVGSDVAWRIFEQDFGPTGPTREAQVRQQILSSLYNGPFGPESGTALSSSRQPVLLAWLSRAPSEVKLVETGTNTLATTLLYSELPVRFGVGKVTLPRGLLNSRIVENDGSICYGQGLVSLSPDFGEAEIQFELPAPTRALDPSEFTLYVTSDGGWFVAPKMSLYDFTTEQWSEINEPVLGRNRVREPDAFLSDSGVIRLRVENSNRNQGGCLYFDAAIEGELDAPATMQEAEIEG